MISAGRIDNRIGSARFGLQKRRVVERPDDRLDVVGRNRAVLRLVTNQAADLIGSRFMDHADKSGRGPWGRILLLGCVAAGGLYWGFFRTQWGGAPKRPLW